MIYAYSFSEERKQKIARYIIEEERVVLSTQVLQEVSNTLHKKFGIDYTTIKNTIEECVADVEKLHINTHKTIYSACDIAKRYRFSFYDSLIIAAALESDCDYLFSEDMQHNQIIDGSLKIINPFIIN